MSQDKSTPAHAPDQCPDRGGELLKYDDPDTGPELVCTECSRWAPTTEFDSLVVAVRLARIRRAV